MSKSLESLERIKGHFNPKDIINKELFENDFNIIEKVLKPSCLTEDELYAYCDDLHFYAWHIDNLEIFDEPQELEKYMHIKHYFLGRTYVPQSWCYIEVNDGTEC